MNPTVSKLWVKAVTPRSAVIYELWASLLSTFLSLDLFAAYVCVCVRVCEFIDPSARLSTCNPKYVSEDSENPFFSLHTISSSSCLCV